ncbi:MAG: L-threonylcarbamoyladenylate synthase [Candidatus Woesearchaeota archaeon]
MRTKILKANRQAIAKAAKILKNNGIVAFPTETVYGLGADAFNAAAVRKVFAAKGRPADDPLIVHVSSVSDAEKAVKKIPAVGRRLMKKYWPGPLTLVMPKSKRVPAVVTAGLPTVAVRMPSHPVALALCRAVGPIAAPSANTFGKPSPTRAMHVYEDLKGKIPLIIDGGSTDIGVESTIVSLAGKPRLLRPGKITIEQLQKFLPDIEIVTKAVKKPLAPGMKYRHYSPKTPVVLVLKPTARKIAGLVKKEQGKGKKVGLLCAGRYHAGAERVIIIGKTPEAFAKRLFEALRWLDSQKLDVIIAEGLPEKGFGHAVMNRLRRAASRVI